MSAKLIDSLCNKALYAFDGTREVIAVHLSNGQEFVAVADRAGQRAERNLNSALMCGRDHSDGTPFQKHRVTVKAGKNGPDVVVINAPSVQPA